MQRFYQALEALHFLHLTLRAVLLGDRTAQEMSLSDARRDGAFLG